MKKTIVLVDDDTLVQICWRLVADLKDINLLQCNSWEEFLKLDIPRNSNCYLDFSLLPISDDFFELQIKTLSQKYSVFITSGHASLENTFDLPIVSKNFPIDF